MKKEFTYRELMAISAHLRNGLAHKPLPVASVLLPLRTFAKKAQAELEAVKELAPGIEDEDELNEVLARAVEVSFPDVKIEALASDEYDLSLADIQLLEMLSDG